MAEERKFRIGDKVKFKPGGTLDQAYSKWYPFQVAELKHNGHKPYCVIIGKEGSVLNYYEDELILFEFSDGLDNWV